MCSDFFQILMKKGFAISPETRLLPSEGSPPQNRNRLAFPVCPHPLSEAPFCTMWSIRNVSGKDFKPREKFPPLEASTTRSFSDPPLTLTPFCLRLGTFQPSLCPFLISQIFLPLSGGVRSPSGTRRLVQNKHPCLTFYPKLSRTTPHF